jgi:hypothetical protein
MTREAQAFEDSRIYMTLEVERFLGIARIACKRFADPRHACHNRVWQECTGGDSPGGRAPRRLETPCIRGGWDNGPHTRQAQRLKSRVGQLPARAAPSSSITEMTDVE